MCCHARAMSVWFGVGQPSRGADTVLPLLVTWHLRPGGETETCGLAPPPRRRRTGVRRRGRAPDGGAAYVVGDPALLRAPAPDGRPAPRPDDAGAGPKSSRCAGEVVDAAQVLDDDALDAQVVAPHLLDQLGVVPALDEDPALAGHPGPLAGHRHRSRRRTTRSGRGGARHRGRQHDGPPLQQEAGTEREASRRPRRSSSVSVPRSRSTETISPHQSVMTSSTTSPIVASAGIARPRAGARQSEARTSDP